MIHRLSAELTQKAYDLWDQGFDTYDIAARLGKDFPVGCITEAAVANSLAALREAARQGTFVAA